MFVIRKYIKMIFSNRFLNYWNELQKLSLNRGSIMQFESIVNYDR